MGSAPDAGETHGALRDAVASLHNLHALLRSPKVGPRAIEPVLSEIRQQLSPLSARVEALLASPSSGGGVAEALELSAFTSERLGEAASAVARVEASGLDARSRLSLEADVARLTPLIDAARGLVELVHASLEPKVELDLSALLEEALCASSQRVPFGGPSVTAMIELPPRGRCTVAASTRVALALCHLAVGHVASVASAPAPARAATRAGGNEGASGTPKLRLSPVDAREGRERVGVEVALATESGRGDAMLVRPPLIVPPTEAVVRLVAARCGASVRFEPVKASARVELPAAGEPEPSTGSPG